LSNGTPFKRGKSVRQEKEEPWGNEQRLPAEEQNKLSQLNVCYTIPNPILSSQRHLLSSPAANMAGQAANSLLSPL
jgi:hypothetical protein